MPSEDPPTTEYIAAPDAQESPPPKKSLGSICLKVRLDSLSLFHGVDLVYVGCGDVVDWWRMAVVDSQVWAFGLQSGSHGRHRIRTWNRTSTAKGVSVGETAPRKHILWANEPALRDPPGYHICVHSRS